jgi:uncharacterized protein
MIWRTSVVTEGPSVSDPYARLTRDVEKVRTFLIAQGLPEHQVVVSAVETTTIRSSQRQGPQSDNGGPDIRGSVAGYHLKQSLEIRSSEIDKLTDVSRRVTQLIHQGILLESEKPQYLYTKLSETKVVILAEAARDAKDRAKQIAASTGSTVGDLRSAEMGVLQITAADSNDVTGFGVNDTESLEKDITAVVHVTFAVN